MGDTSLTFLPDDAEVAYHAYSSHNYDAFKFIDGNRDVEHLANIRRSIKQNGLYRQPILVNENMEIIEGQHRFVICKEMELPIEFVVQPGLKAIDCAPLNTGRTNWRPKNYVHLHAIDNEGYHYFEILLNRFGFSPRITYVAIGRSITGGGVNQVVKLGNLACNYDEYTRGGNVLRWLVQFNKDIKESDLRGRKDALQIALIFARNSKSVSVSKLTERVHQNFSRYGKAIANIEDAIEKTNDIYNYKCRAENTVDLVSEYRIAVRKAKAHESKTESE